MKLRIVTKCGLFIPQYYKKNRYTYGHSWTGFCQPNIRFASEKMAKDFLNMIEVSIPATFNGKKCDVVYKNYKDKE